MLPTKTINQMFFISSCVFALEGILQIAFSFFVDPLPISLIHKVVPVAHVPIAGGLLVMWLIGLFVFMVGLARVLKTGDSM
jgi:hypothetical protein